ncbi:antitoxin family protein [Leptolyngbya sp. FACHB-261]|uniref:antitoxin family protein n=1 Tax=Leptolyngbya sp. FACHB-261 TaxID=2692806 RepID=UPI00168655E9|nr:antitoxin family protein [Leptolyngbya sp. FACHB-261]MBD2100586.1 antitoxin family protein [Leptolyngbya sp. FACHB-261]
MTTTIQAVYEQGVLRPTQPIKLAEGTRVEVIVIVKELEENDRSPAQILAAIAALPSENDDTEFSGQDHDQVLYGEYGEP